MNLNFILKYFTHIFLLSDCILSEEMGISRGINIR